MIVAFAVVIIITNSRAGAVSDHARDHTTGAF